MQSTEVCLPRLRAVQEEKESGPGRANGANIFWFLIIVNKLLKSRLNFFKVKAQL